MSMNGTATALPNWLNPNPPTDEFADVPSSMKQARRWLVHRNKKPFYPNGESRAGSLDELRDTARLGTFDQAVGALKWGSYDGLGFALGDGWQGIDLDKIADNGLNGLAGQLPGYVETSPSGAGVHAIGYGADFKNLGSKKKTGIEAYSGKRYFTVTGSKVRGEIEDLSPFVESTLAPKHSQRAKTKDQREREPSGEVTDETIADLRDALDSIPADDYSTWISMGHALKTLGDVGRDLWLDWSESSQKHEPKSDPERWESFTPSRTGYAAVFAEARRQGWEGCRNTLADGLFGPIESKSTQFKLLTVADLKRRPLMSWRIKELLPARGFVQIYGPSRSGKSFLVLDMAATIAKGEEWFGHKVTKAPVVYICLEDADGLRLRTDACISTNDTASPEELFFLIDDFVINREEHIAALGSAVPDGAVVIIDTQHRAAPAVDENSSKDMGQIIEGAKQLQASCNGLVILVAHTGKDPTNGVRGHSSQIAAVDAAIEVSRKGDVREFCTAKVKNGRDDIRHGFRLETVHLGTDEDGDPITSCVIRRTATTTGPIAEGANLNPSELVAVNAYRDAATNGNAILNTQDGFNGIHLDSWRAEFNRQSTADSREAKRKQFERVRKTLQQKGLLNVDNDIYRLSTFHWQETAFVEAATRTKPNVRDMSGTRPDPSTRTGQDTPFKGCPMSGGSRPINGVEQE